MTIRPETSTSITSLFRQLIRISTVSPGILWAYTSGFTPKTHDDVRIDLYSRGLAYWDSVGYAHR
ncbi:hypothetical protein BN903_40 [Halorubrum sp. AJ67]|nr:hypothetical protein BN903_40 [Halorubrum sp. AJ67]